VLTTLSAALAPAVALHGARVWELQPLIFKGKRRETCAVEFGVTAMGEILVAKKK
jgi:hypothetical protein